MCFFSFMVRHYTRRPRGRNTTENLLHFPSIMNRIPRVKATRQGNDMQAAAVGEAEVKVEDKL